MHFREEREREREGDKNFHTWERETHMKFPLWELFYFANTTEKIK